MAPNNCLIPDYLYYRNRLHHSPIVTALTLYTHALYRNSAQPIIRLVAHITQCTSTMYMDMSELHSEQTCRPNIDFDSWLYGWPWPWMELFAVGTNSANNAQKVNLKCGFRTVWYGLYSTMTTPSSYKTDFTLDTSYPLSSLSNILQTTHTHTHTHTA